MKALRYFTLILFIFLFSKNTFAQSCFDTAGYLIIDVGGNKTSQSPLIDLSGPTPQELFAEFSFKVDDGEISSTVSFLPVSGYTYQDMINILQAELYGTTVAMVNGNLRITSNTKGAGSKVELIMAGNEYGIDFRLLLTGYIKTEAPVYGQSSTCSVAISSPIAPVIPPPCHHLRQQLI